MQLTDIIQSIGIVATLIVAIWQMRVQTRHVRASNELALSLKFDEINKVWIEHPKLFKMLDDEYLSEQTGNEHEILENVMFIIFNTLQLVYLHHHKYGLVDKEDWAEWHRTIEIYMGKPYLRGWWQSNHLEYGARFRKHIATITNDDANDTTQQG